MVVLFSTGILPLLSIALLALRPKFDLSLSRINDKLVIMLFTASFYYLGFMLLNRIKAYPVFKLIMIAGALIVIANLVVSLKWRISSHMSALGGITGAVLALAFRTGVNPVLAVLALIVASGLAGSSRLVLQKNSLPQVLTGYIVGLTIMYLVIYFV